VARRKKRKNKTKRFSLSIRPGIKKGKRKPDSHMLSLPAVLKVSAIVCVLIGVAAGFIFLKKYVEETSLPAEETLPIELVGVPDWVTEPLKEKIYAAARAYGQDPNIDENTASSIQQNIEALVAWLRQVQVQVTHDTISISGSWRKPLALVKRGLQSFYVDEELAVMDFVPLPNLPIVRVEGLSLAHRPPLPGDIWQSDDLAAAVAVLARLQKMDKLISPEKPLLDEIDRIDVSNFDGRENNRFPHIVLYTKDNTEIIWGAEIGTWQRHLEATDQEKLTNLYAYYKEHGSLLGGAKYINLRYSQVKVSLPVDKY
jgi:hypothetical protein